MGIEEKKFTSPTYGKMSFDEVLDRLHQYIKEDETATYNITIGTDSQTDKETRMVLVICACREGHGGIFFSYCEKLKPMRDLRSKIYYETNLSIEAAKLVNDKIYDVDADYTFSIHADIGNNGPTAKLINEIVGWITAEGYDCRIKPFSYTASCIANKITK